MSKVRAKKYLGQHFLNSEKIAQDIVNSLSHEPKQVCEIGPGMGVLTKYLIEESEIDLKLIEIDNESVGYLYENYPQLNNRIIEGDFLKLDIDSIFKEEFSVIGNFPYNISSQIFFKILEYQNKIPQVVCMLQKEVAERLASPPGSKAYGILSVLLQTFYDIEYLFTVGEEVFTPPPKVKSGVIRLTRNNREALKCDEKLFKRVVKTSFNQRRKTISNSLKPIPFNRDNIADNKLFSMRPEQLSVQDFEELTIYVQENLIQNK